MKPQRGRVSIARLILDKLIKKFISHFLQFFGFFWFTHGFSFYSSELFFYLSCSLYSIEASHSLTVLSQLAEAKVLLSEENATE